MVSLREQILQIVYLYKGKKLWYTIGLYLHGLPRTNVSRKNTQEKKGSVKKAVWSSPFTVNKRRF